MLLSWRRNGEERRGCSKLIWKQSLCIPRAVFCAAHRRWKAGVHQGGDLTDSESAMSSSLLPLLGFTKTSSFISLAPQPRHQVLVGFPTASPFHCWERHTGTVKGSVKQSPVAEFIAYYAFAVLLVAAKTHSYNFPPQK